MFFQQLQTIVAQKKRMGMSNATIKNILKETLQWYVLDYIYNSSFSKALIFTGGSALRICYGLNRLSEDLDFDLEYGKTMNKSALADEIVNYFKKKLRFGKITFSIKGKNKKIYLKFPILYELGVASLPESNLLYVKIEIAENLSKYGEIEFVPIAQLNLNFLLRCYNLSTLCANKIIAILERTYTKGKNQDITFKGRDYYDLLWLLQRNIIPYKPRLEYILGIKEDREIRELLLNKVKSINPAYLREDLLPLFEDSRFVNGYVENYKDMVSKYLNFGH